MRKFCEEAHLILQCASRAERRDLPIASLSAIKAQPSLNCAFRVRLKSIL
jgi:hypothetical protein